MVDRPQVAHLGQDDQDIFHAPTDQTGYSPWSPPHNYGSPEGGQMRGVRDTALPVPSAASNYHGRRGWLLPAADALFGAGLADRHLAPAGTRAVWTSMLPWRCCCGLHCENERVHVRREDHGPIPSGRARVRPGVRRRMAWHDLPGSAAVHHRRAAAPEHPRARPRPPHSSGRAGAVASDRGCAPEQTRVADRPFRVRLKRE